VARFGLSAPIAGSGDMATAVAAIAVCFKKSRREGRGMPAIMKKPSAFNVELGKCYHQVRQSALMDGNFCKSGGNRQAR
jgi:hypothetical protein